MFAGHVGKISGFSKLKIALDEASGVTDWRLHDLRRTAASKMQGLGIPNHVVQAVLNHAVPGVGGDYLQDELENAEGRGAGDMGDGAGARSSARVAERRA